MFRQEDIMFLNVSNEPTRIMIWLTTFIILNLRFYKKTSMKHSLIKCFIDSIRQKIYDFLQKQLLISLGLIEDFEY